MHMQRRIRFDNERLRDIIESNNINKPFIAKELNVSEKQFNSWLMGKSIPGKAYIDKLTNIIGIDLSYSKNINERKNKYNNEKPMVDGIVFDSLKEANRYKELKVLSKQGVIKDLERQVKYVLIPKQKDANGNCIERECSYKADFVYKKNGEVIVEDTKGFRTSDYIIKRKLMLHVYGIRIKEI